MIEVPTRWRCDECNVALEILNLIPGLPFSGTVTLSDPPSGWQVTPPAVPGRPVGVRCPAHHVELSMVKPATMADIARTAMQDGLKHRH